MNNQTSDTDYNAVEQLEELKQVQDVNESLVDIPDEIEINGLKISISPKTLGEMVLVDKEIFELQKIIFIPEDTEITVDSAEFWDKSYEKEVMIVNQCYKVVSQISSVPTDWCEKNLSAKDINLIIDMYIGKCSSDLSDVAKKLQEARQL